MVRGGLGEMGLNSTSEEQVRYGNRDFLRNCVEYILGEEDMIIQETTLRKDVYMDTEILVERAVKMVMDKFFNTTSFFAMHGGTSVLYSKATRIMKKMMYINGFRGLWVMLLFLVACRPNLKDSSESSTAYLFYDTAVVVQSISIQSTSGDEVDFILKESSWVNKDNQAMNASFAEEMLDALHNASFESVKESQEVTARQALRDKGLRVTVDWADGTKKTFYLVTAFDPSKTFVCFASDSAMEGALHQAWVSDEKKKITRDFTSAFDPSMAEFGAESMRDRSILSMDNPLEQIQWIDVVFYDTLMQAQ